MSTSDANPDAGSACMFFEPRVLHTGGVQPVTKNCQSRIHWISNPQ
jgi:hypothetical protein